jgi:putative peptidoglycan lipid II flippase
LGAEVGATDEGLNVQPTVDPRDGFARHTALMAVGTTLSRVSGMLRLTATVAALGFGTLSDTYAAANTTPNIVYELILGGILTSVFVPVFVRWATTHGREESWEVAQRMLTLALVVLVAIAAIGALFAPAIMRLYLSASDPDGREAQIELGASFLRWFMPQIVFYGVGAVAIGVLQAGRRFVIVMFAPILNNLSVIATMLAFIAIRGDLEPSGLTTGQRTLLAAGTTFGIVAMTLALWPALRRMGFRWRLRFDWGHPAITELGRLARWTVVYVAANQLAYLLVIVLNNRLGAGVYFAYTQAFVFFQLPHAIFAVSIFTALMPDMAERWTDGRPDDVRELWSRGMRTTLVVMVPAALAYIVLAEPIVRLFAQYGAADPRGTDLMATALAGFALGLPFFSAFQLLTRTFYAMHDARTPAVVNLAVAGVNALANVALSLGLGLGVGGLALGHAVSYVFGAVALGAILRRRLGRIDGKRIGRTVGRVVPIGTLCAAASLGTALLIRDALGVATAPQRLVQVLSAVGVGLLVFLAGALIVRLEEADDLIGVIRRRLRP